MKRKTSVITISCRTRKEKIAKVQEKRAELDRSRQALEDAQTESNYEKAAELQYGTIPQLEKN